MEPQVYHQSLFLSEKEIDTPAKDFIQSAHNIGVSVKLINRFLQESNYSCTITIVQEELKVMNIISNNNNCSRGTGIGRRYLTHILDKFKCSTLERFPEIALDEATTFYDFDDDAFVKYWYEFSEFQNQLIKNEEGYNIYNPANDEWVMRALTYFGYTLISLSNYLIQNNNYLKPALVHHLYREALKRTDRNYVYPGSLHPSSYANAKVINFWKVSRRIGREFHTIIEWTKIFLGQDCKEDTIRETARVN